jgi:uncharacterized protein YqiB (DUF1249 family)
VIVESDIPVSWRTRPRGFAALMSLYETNYLRLVALAGDPSQLSGQYRSCVPGDCELVLDVLGHSPYTLELAMSYLLPVAGTGDERVPDLRLRLYRDARVLEVLPLPGEETSADARGLQRRWARNLLLNKWLEYLAGHAHRFQPCS